MLLESVRQVGPHHPVQTSKWNRHSLKGTLGRDHTKVQLLVDEDVCKQRDLHEAAPSSCSVRSKSHTILSSGGVPSWKAMVCIHNGSVSIASQVHEWQFASVCWCSSWMHLSHLVRYESDGLHTNPVQVPSWLVLKWSVELGTNLKCTAGNWSWASVGFLGFLKQGRKWQPTIWCVNWAMCDVAQELSDELHIQWVHGILGIDFGPSSKS